MHHSKAIRSDSYNADCMEFFKHPMYDNYFDLAIVDVEYGKKVGSMAYLNQTHKVNQRNGTTMTITADYKRKQWDNSPCTADTIQLIKRISKHQIIFGVDFLGLDLGSGVIKWTKRLAKDGTEKKVSFSSYENAYCSFINHTHEIKLLWDGFQQAKSLEEPTRSQGNKKLNEKRIHPTQKPVLLYESLLIYAKQYIQVNSMVDTHEGSGSSKIAAHKQNIDFMGTEIDSDYFHDKEIRFSNYLNQAPF